MFSERVQQWSEHASEPPTMAIGKKSGKIASTNFIIHLANCKWKKSIIILSPSVCLRLVPSVPTPSIDFVYFSMFVSGARMRECGMRECFAQSNSSI